MCPNSLALSLRSHLSGPTIIAELKVGVFLRIARVDAAKLGSGCTNEEEGREQTTHLG
jgi:hypothetical protein